jgi:hypothetical protein
MRFVAVLGACVGIALTAAGCDPTTERRYFTEGAGVDLYTADRASQVELLNQYIEFICNQAGAQCGGNWTAFVQTGMNDIDQRCDGFLTWLDARRRDKEPILAELSALNTTAHTIMAISGASPKSLDIVTAAFGLATATYNNWNSRLLISINQSTVQQIVYKGQGDFRDKIKAYAVPDQPTAIYLLRNYLRLCMPTTIEASINTTTTLVLGDAPVAARKNLVVSTTTPRTLVIAHPASDATYKTLREQLFPNGATTSDPKIVAYVREILGPPPIAIGVILNQPGQASLRQKISECIKTRDTPQKCGPGSLASSR